MGVNDNVLCTLLSPLVPYIFDVTYAPYNVCVCCMSGIDTAN